MLTGSIAKSPYIAAISSGKGGVGKSVLSVNIAKCIADSGAKVLLWDANRSFPNCHLMIGVEPLIRLSDVYSGMVSIDKAVFKVEENFYLLADYPGAGIDSATTNVEFSEVLHNLLFDTDFDFIIIDTPAGVSDISLKVASIANEVNIMITDEPTSLLDGYGLIKILLNYIEKEKLKLLVNNVIDYDDGQDISRKLNLATKKFLGFSIEVAGLFPYSRVARQSIVTQELFVRREPDDELSKSVVNYTKKLIDMTKFEVIEVVEPIV